MPPAGEADIKCGYIRFLPANQQLLHLLYEEVAPPPRAVSMLLNVTGPKGCPRRWCSDMMTFSASPVGDRESQNWQNCLLCLLF